VDPRKAWHWAGTKLRRRAEDVLAGLLGVMFCAFVVQIVFRYFFNLPTGWTTELTVVTWLWMVLWGAAFVVKESEEIRIDLVTSMVGRRAFNIRVPEGGAAFAGGPGPEIHFRNFFHGEFGGMELASITPKLGAYFGATEGVLVVQAPDNGAFKLEDGDVIQTIDGRKPEDGTHALRILRSYQSGEKLNMQVLRQRKTLTLAVTMPERPEGDDFMLQPMPAIPPVPPMAPTPGVPGSPGGAGTID